MEIGVKIKDLRLKNQLTQEELADRCELTKGYISQLENDLTSPSISTLKDILKSLGSSLSEFFMEEGSEQIVFKESDQFEKENDDNTIKWLVPTAQKNSMEPIMMTVKAGGTSGKDLPHEGEEFGLVLKGSVIVVIGKKEYRANVGDTFYFRSNKTHFVKNNSQSEAKVIWVSCPPNF